MKLVWRLVGSALEARGPTQYLRIKFDGLLSGGLADTEAASGAAYFSPISAGRLPPESRVNPGNFGVDKLWLA
jgi:hypothetical protein